jgi:DNA-binding NarL/FixJ family response regulator
MMKRAGGSSAAPAVPRRIISVAIVEDNRLVREGITVLLNQKDDLVVVASSANGDATLMRDARPDVILLDLGLRNGDSLRLAQRVKREHPEAKIVVMDLLPAQEEIIEFVNVGVNGFIMKDATLEDLVETIRKVESGVDVLPPQMAGTLFSEIARYAVTRGRPAVVAEAGRMTPREREVINLIAEGLSNKEIAQRLHIATHTVKSHVRNVMEKLTLHTRLQIAAYARNEDE